MNVKQLFTEERAVSPVIGVILMVAITVILAAVIGTFVLGLGDSLQQTSPTATFDKEQVATSVPNTNATTPVVTFTHEGGDSLDSTNLEMRQSFSESGVDSANMTYETSYSDATETTAGDTVRLDVSYSGASTTGTIADSGDTVRLVWTSSDGSNSATIGTFDLPNEVTASA